MMTARSVPAAPSCRRKRLNVADVLRTQQAMTLDASMGWSLDRSVREVEEAALRGQRSFVGDRRARGVLYSRCMCAM
jgi:hypothetical protein